MCEPGDYSRGACLLHSLNGIAAPLLLLHVRQVVCAHGLLLAKGVARGGAFCWVPGRCLHLCIAATWPAWLRPLRILGASRVLHAGQESILHDTCQGSAGPGRKKSREATCSPARLASGDAIRPRPGACPCAYTEAGVPARPPARCWPDTAAVCEMRLLARCTGEAGCFGRGEAWRTAAVGCADLCADWFTTRDECTPAPFTWPLSLLAAVTDCGLQPQPPRAKPPSASATDCALSSPPTEREPTAADPAGWPPS